MGVLDEGGYRRKGGRFKGKCGAFRCNQWGLCCIVVQQRRALPKLLWGGLVYPVLNMNLSIYQLTVSFTTVQKTQNVTAHLPVQSIWLQTVVCCGVGNNEEKSYSSNLSA